MLDPLAQQGDDRMKRKNTMNTPSSKTVQKGVRKLDAKELTRVSGGFADLLVSSYRSRTFS